MANIKEWLESAEREFGEMIEAVVVGKHDDRWRSGAPLPDEDVVLSREDGLRKLDQEFDCGFGGADCFPMYAWTKTRVFLVHEYDGATKLGWVPRNPQAIAPDFGGNSCE
ncbi:hypothetical protein GN330_22530 [Nitratireductor sp. CAU 1489]|uniref:Uncharacterized protein n=1 Tax=Nitratireductor arenosus TaxID=2682096 RepID=A0A844QPY5_9HYPH|nr:hypothetical protein [Nitratireductor arenosus]MVB00031.1 hypothetical protein [Nitratireductor arenosus]